MVGGRTDRWVGGPKDGWGLLRHNILFLVKPGKQEVCEHGFSCQLLGLCGVRFPKKYYTLSLLCSWLCPDPRFLHPPSPLTCPYYPTILPRPQENQPSGLSQSGEDRKKKRRRPCRLLDSHPSDPDHSRPRLGPPIVPVNDPNPRPHHRTPSSPAHAPTFSSTPITHSNLHRHPF